MGMGSLLSLILDVLVWVTFGIPDKMQTLYTSSCICDSSD